MAKPDKLLTKYSNRLFADPIEREKFVNSLISPTREQGCILWCREKPSAAPFEIDVALSWQPQFVDRLTASVRPGKHPLHTNGAYYCLDLSSVFAATTILTIPTPVKLVLDVCAAPGGKSIFAWRSLQPELLLCNEVIGKRTAALISNLRRCQIHRTVMMSMDAKILAESIAKTAYLTIVDAPCSGQSLLAKGIKNPGCFHPVTINKNANRQKRILANSAQLVAPQGYLAYMTCTYAIAENEQVCEWFLNRFPQFVPVVVPDLVPYQSHLNDLPCYRIWPQSGLGAGAFTALFRNTEEGKSTSIPDAFWQHARLTYL